MENCIILNKGEILQDKAKMFVLDYGICELLLREQNVLWPTKLLTGVILVLLPALPLVKMNIEDLYLLLRKETNFD